MAASGLARTFYRALYPGINESSPFRSWSAEGQLPEVCSGDPPSRLLDVLPRARVTTTECLSIADALLPRVCPGLVSWCLHEPLMEPGLTTIFRCARSSLPMLIPHLTNSSHSAELGDWETNHVCFCVSLPRGGLAWRTLRWHIAITASTPSAS